MKFLKLFVAILVASFAVLGPVRAQEQATTIVVPFAAGGGTDVYVRMIADEMTQHGMPVIVANKPGASGIVAASYVARARPDGRTVLVSFLGILANNTVLFNKLPYDPEKDFESVTQIAVQPTILVGRADLPYHDIREMVAYAKANPGKINRGSPGASVLSNLGPIYFEKQAGISTTYIPFNGDSQAITALLGGSIDIYGTSITSTLSLIRSGKLRLLGVKDAARLPQVPEAPTFKESGFDIEASLRYYLSVPAGTPKTVVETLNRAVNAAIADPALIAKARALGMEPKGGTPQEMDHLIKADADRWLPVLRSLNLPKT
ncbi:MAG: tripartite tricarboxylate transporter substrate binding protein [Burkholderiales bacterium]|nr:tripartite tricarboxylate transporter substrate binding protein [Burkholderiales bacterium]